METSKIRKKRLFTLKSIDFKWSYFRGSGAGGQKRNKTSSGVRCTHIPSGAVATSTETRSQSKNKKVAFRKVATSQVFRDWVRIEAARVSGKLADIEKRVDKDMRTINLRVEIREDDKWVKI